MGDRERKDENRAKDENRTDVPASEEDSGLIDRKDDAPVQSWPGSGGPGTIPPPG